MAGRGKALLLKERGNDLFRAGDYSGAEDLYTQAIMFDSNNPQLFTNRANARLKLQSWDDVINDCLRSIEVQPNNIKAYRYLAQAQIELHHPAEGLVSAQTAYTLALHNAQPAQALVSLILRAKKERWELRERDRRRRESELLAELEDRLEMAQEQELRAIEHRVETGVFGPVQAQEESEAVRTLTRQKVENLRSVFAIADPKIGLRGEVPDHLIDSITFSIMHDPVITKSGQSYERVTLLEHLKNSQTDPLTREPLEVSDLRPNLGLRAACELFLQENGWAVDY